jgi:hypothetical protein
VPDRRSFAIVLAAALLSAPSAGASSGTRLPFTTVTQGSSQPTVPNERLGRTIALVMPTIGHTYGLEVTLTKAEFAKLQGIGFQTHFAIGISLAARTSGYSVTIKGITLQRISRSKRQFCIVAQVTSPKPGDAVIQRGTYAEHTVQLSSNRFRIDEFHWAIPTRFVLRSTAGKLLDVSKSGGGYNGYGAKVTGKAAACRA